MATRGVRLLPLGLVVLSTSIAYAQSPAGTAGDPNEQVKSAAPAPPPPPARPAEMPPKPPKVTCSRDTLTIAADNSTLDSILTMVRGCTGAKIDVPEGAGKIRSFELLGPGPVHKVLDELLSGTQYNYVIQSSDQNPAKVETVLLTARKSEGPGGGAADSSNPDSTDVVMTAGRRAWTHMQKFDKPDPNSESDMKAQATAETAFSGDATPPSPAEPADANAAQNASPAPAEANAPTSSTADAASSPPPPTPAALPNPSGDSKSSFEDKVNSMQQMFDQRRQMIQKENAANQNTGPSN